MEAKEATNVHKERIAEAKKKKEFIKIIFQYPASLKMIVKRGKVLQVMDNGFLFDEMYDGTVSYSYDYIVEVKGGEK